jgi:hypothetical protein
VLNENDNELKVYFLLLLLPELKVVKELSAKCYEIPP